MLQSKPSGSNFSYNLSLKRSGITLKKRPSQNTRGCIRGHLRNKTLLSNADTLGELRKSYWTPAADTGTKGALTLSYLTCLSRLYLLVSPRLMRQDDVGLSP